MSITVLGAGIGGLSAAHYLRRRTFKPITVLEATERVGGWIKSEVRGDDVVFEAGPRTIRPRGEPGSNTLEILEEIKAEEHIKPILRSHVAAKNRMIFAKNELCLLPSSLSSAVFPKSPFSQSMVGMILNDLKAKPVRVEDESMHDFVSRRFGQEFADYLIGPLICGICAGDSKEISVNFLMKKIFENEQRYGSVIRGTMQAILTEKSPKSREFMHINLAKRAKTEKWSIYSLKGGLESLPKLWAENLRSREVAFEFNKPCEKVVFCEDKAEVTANGQTTLNDKVISSIPAFSLAGLVQEQHPKLAEILKEIPYVDVAVVNLQYSDPKLLKNPGFGVLVPPVEKLPILGVIFDSCCFGISDSTVLTVMMGGKWFRQWFGENPTEKSLAKTAIEGVQKVLKVDAKPDAVKVNLLRKCIPQYTVGHLKRVKKIRDYVGDHRLPLLVCGAAYDGVGINDVILSARNAVEVEEVH